MPTLVWLYLSALLDYRTSASGVALAEALDPVAPDRLTRMLQADGSGHTLLALALRTLFGCTRGPLIVDDPVIPKPFATAIDGRAWGLSPTEGTPVWGGSMGLLVWTNGTPRSPLAWRRWHKAGPSKYALALELLRYARQR